MTHLVYGAKTKKALKEFAELLNTTKENEPSHRRVFFEDPVVYLSWKGYEGTMLDMPEGTKITCTNHPKRTWFATVERTTGGKWKVK
jgi:hypothetical protein